MARGYVTMRDVRPCMIFEFRFGGLLDGYDEAEKWSKGLWHCWVKRKRDEEIPVKYGFKHRIQTVVYALVEREGGTTELVEANRIKFLDDAFADYNWPEEK